MSVNCDRCSWRSKDLDDYENYPQLMGDMLVVCHACAEEMRNEK